MRGWLGRADRIVVQPEPDLADHDGSILLMVAHDPPTAMRELVVFRAGQCVFPNTGQTRALRPPPRGRLADPGDGGAPGQTRPDNLSSR